MISGLVLLALLAILALLAWGLAGGWDGLRPQASSDDRRVVGARRAAGGELDDLLASTAAAMGGGQVLASVRYDRCEKGQNNWKVHDGYTLRCELTEAAVRRADDAQVTATAARFDAALRAAGWSAAAAQQMTLPADPQRSVLDSTRSGSYARDGRRHLLDVVVTSQANSPFVPALPTGPEVETTGDAAGYRQALAADGPKVVTLTTVRYFEDS